MTSSMSTGERRWVSSGRRGGMTVIGKVVVPKPINLPSQRLENHGLDPNVEIVPKGTLGWGGKSSSTASNPWGSSTPSPNTDGGGGSPSRLSARPSSGGSDTRPSTASSDRAHEPVNSAWGQNSRPSSASGLVTSNRSTLAPLRPRSAETRPGSSHLSRFAESVPDDSGAWGATGTAEKLGEASSKNDGFSLASGDFPTLGAEKDNSEKNVESQDRNSYDRPDLSSYSGEAPAKERNSTFIDGESSVGANVKNDDANSWRRENPAYREDGVRPSVEKWHGDPQHYPNASIRPHHYEAWRGPPVNNPPGGVWYRGPPGAPPYGNPVPPGGFPMEPFPYFHPQMPGGAALANPQPVPSPVAGPRGHHPKNGDMYRPHMPDAYIRPGMPMRPGFYPGPVPYDGYFGPPMGYCNSNERDIPYTGVGVGPAVYNRYSGQNSRDPGNYHARSDGYGSTGKALVPEHEDFGHPHNTRGPYKVLLKQHNGLDGKDDKKWEGNVTSTTACNEKGGQPSTLEDNEWGADHKEEGINPRKTAVGEEASYQTSDGRGSRSNVSTKVNVPENMVNRKAIDAISGKKLEPAACSFPESQQPLLAVPKESSLIQKIEGLNAKARGAQHDGSSAYSRDDHGKKTQVVKSNHSANEAGSGPISHGRSQSHRISTPPSHGEVVSVGDRNFESTIGSGVAISRRPHGIQGRSDHRGKGRINAHDVDEWPKRSPVVDYPHRVSAAVQQAGTSSIASMQDHHTPILAPETCGAYPQMKDEREIGEPVFDPNDPQHAKRKELAQRLKQRQKEEEERISRQKANARAKLEELNRRAQAVNGSGHKSGPIQNSKEGSQVLAESVVVASVFGGPNMTSNPNLNSGISESNTNRSERSTSSSRGLVLVTPECAPVQSIPQNLPVPTQSDDSCKVTSEALSSVMSRQNRVGFRQKHNKFPEKSATEKVPSMSIPEALEGHGDMPVGSIRSAEPATNERARNFEPSVPESSSAHQKRKNKSVKNKHKVEAVPSTASLPLSTLKESNPPNISIESNKPKTQEPELLPSSLQSVMASQDSNQSSDQHSFMSNEESRVRVNNVFRSQNPRRVQRNPQNNRVAEKFHSGDAAVWAPVRSHNRAEDADESIGTTVVGSSVKRDIVQNNNAKNKRAEIEKYVPKPVAKELALLGTIEQPVVVPSVESADLGSQGTAGRNHANADTDKVGFTVKYKNVDGRQNKQQGKAQGSWRQRGASESASIQGFQDGLSHASNSFRNVQGSVEHHQQPKESSENEQPKFSGEGNSRDVLNTEGNSELAPVGKEKGVMGRGKRQPFRGHKSMGNSQDNDQRKINSGDTVIGAPQTESTSPRDGRGAGERSISHWQPKSQAFSGSNEDYVQPDQNLNVEVSRGMKTESSSRSGMLPPSHNMEAGDMKSHVEVAANVEAKRGKKKPPHSPNQGPSEPPSGTTDFQQEHRTSGFRKNGNQNSRFGRGHGDWSSGGQVNRDRQRHNSHYEYQPVGPQDDNSRPGSVEGPNHNTGARFRERGSRRGGANFYGRQTDSARVDAGHE